MSTGLIGGILSKMSGMNKWRRDFLVMLCIYFGGLAVIDIANNTAIGLFQLKTLKPSFSMN